MLLAGGGKAVVDLDGILPFDGFGSVRDSLCARALVLDAVPGDGAQRVCIVVLDATSIAPDLMTSLRAAATTASGCTGPHLWACVSHTFSAPHVRTPSHLADDAQRERNLRLRDAYGLAVTAAVRHAIASLREVTLSWGSAPTTANVNRDVETPAGWWLGRNPNGFSDHGVRALVARDASDGGVVATLFSADVQPSVLCRSASSDGLHAVSGDIAGEASRALEEGLGGVAMFLVGTAADQAPAEQAVTVWVAADGSLEAHDARGEGFSMVSRVGGELARAACAAADAALAAPALPSVGPIAEWHETTCPGQVRADFHQLAPAREFAFRPAEPVPTTVSVLGVGNLVLVGLQPEVSSLLGSKLRRTAAEQGVQLDVFTLVNGGAKYLPDDEAYDRITYEAMNSGFGRGSDAAISRDVLASAQNMAARLAAQAERAGEQGDSK